MLQHFLSDLSQASAWDGTSATEFKFGSGNTGGSIFNNKWS